MSRQPYIGLRAFSREEQALFFGREQHSNELIQRLNKQHFLAVVGDSGCGKSSLIKAGLIPSLQAGFLAEAGSHWRIVETRPTNEPFANLAKALCEDNALGKDYQTALVSNQFLTRSPFSLHELLAIKPLPNNAKLLIVCDQFEELFRYAKQQSNSEEAAAFAALLLASANPYPLASGEMSNSVYVILTMRSDYLGNCAQFAGLAEAINQGLYLTPRLNRQQLRDAIERPALVCNGKVEPALLVRLLAETGNDADQLPLLQHLLMRLWDNAKHLRDVIPESKPTQRLTKLSRHSSMDAGIQSQGCVSSVRHPWLLDCGNPCRNDVKTQRLIIKLSDYQDDKKTQTLKNALSTHADEAYNELNQAQQLIAKQIFCRLTGAESGKTDTRNPTKVSELMTLTKQSLADITAILRGFRLTGRSFLLPPPDTELTTDTVIDITHESLIRNWERLEQWTQEEAESAAIYRRLEQNALLHDKGEYGFYRTPELETTLNWKEKNPVTAQWASRYGQHFDTAMAFLQQSLEEQQAEQEKERLAQQREIDRQQEDHAKQLEIHLAKSKQRFLLFGLMLAIALLSWSLLERNHIQQQNKLLEVGKYQLFLGQASLLAKQEDYAGAKKVLAETDALDEQVSPSLRHARNLLHSFTQIKGGEAEQVYTGAGYGLLTVAISPDGQLLAAAGEHGTLVLFDVQTGKLLQRLLGHKTEGTAEDNSVRSIAFTPSGQQLISAGADKIILWQRSNAMTPSKPSKTDSQTGKPLVSANDSATEPASADLFQQQQTLDTPDRVMAISISPDGKLLASGGDDKAITLWELNSGKKLKTLSQHREGISSKGLAFSPDGRYLASGSFDDTAIIWQLETGKPSQVLTGHTGDVNQLSFSADSATLATASVDKTLRLWEVATGNQLRVFNGHQNEVFAVSWFGNYLLSGSADRSIRLWDSTSCVSLRLLQGHEAGVTAFALYGGQLWSASNDGTVRRWSLKLPFQQAWGLPSAPFSTVITPALNHVAVGFANGDLSVYDVQKPEPVWHKTAAHSKAIGRLTVNRNGSLLATGSYDSTAKIWQIQQTATGIALQENQTLNGHKDAICALAFSPDSQTLATASYDGQIGLFAVNQTKPAQFINPAHQGGIQSVEFDNIGKQLVSSSEDRSLKLWNLQTSPPTSKNFPLANDSLAWSSISPDGLKLVSVGRDQSVDVYDSLNTQLLYHLTGHESTIFRAVFAPDSQQLATVSGDTTVKFWQLEQGKELFSLALPTEFMRPSSVWNFDFRCLKDKCLIAVPLVRGQLQLYTLAYEGKLTEDASEQKRQQVDVWRLYQNTVDKLLLSNAIQPALQASHETEQLAQHFNQQFPNDAEFAALKKHGDCQQQKIQQLLKPESPALSADCEIILNPIISATQFNHLGISLYKQKQYQQAQTIFAKGLEKFPEDFYILSNDAELALVQGDKQRLQQRLNTLQTLYQQKDGVYIDFYPAIMQFLQYVSDAEQTPEAVLNVIAQTDKAVSFKEWDFSDIQPVLKALSPARQKTAALFIDFFQSRINLDSLKSQLKGGK